MLSSKINHEWNEWILKINVHPHFYRKGIVSVTNEAEPIVHQQELVASVAVAVVRLFTWNESTTL
jgi:hypothetical protein